MQTDDFETVKRKYIDVIENTPDIEKYARWEYILSSVGSDICAFFSGKSKVGMFCSEYL